MQLQASVLLLPSDTNFVFLTQYNLRLLTSNVAYVMLISMITMIIDKREIKCLVKCQSGVGVIYEHTFQVAHEPLSPRKIHSHKEN